MRPSERVPDPSKMHKTTDYMTKFEFTRLLGLRILDLNSRGVCDEDPRIVALRELLDGTNTSVVRRKLPDGSHEDRAVRDLKLSTTMRRMCETGITQRTSCDGQP